MKLNKNIKGIMIIFTICFIIPFSLFFIINLSLQQSDTFNEGFVLCGIDISNLTKSQAEEKLNENYSYQTDEISLTITYNDKIWKFTNEDFKCSSNIHTILEEAYKSTHNGNIFSKLLKIKKMNYSPEIALNYTLNGIDEKIKNICDKIEFEPVNADINYNITKKELEISNSKNGLNVDKEKLYKDIENEIMSHKNGVVKISTQEVAPKVNEKELKLNIKKQSTFSTNYSSSSYDRKNNIKLAINSLNGCKILSGESFSFNQVLGKRTIEKGYKEANIIKNGTFVKGIGGGICQVSTTLYNSLILAGLNIDEVHKHSLPVSYVSPGLDAMVSWNSADLKFTNTTNYPIIITGSCDGNKLNFSIYGSTKEDDVTYKTSYEIIKKIESSGDKIIPDKDGLYADKIMFKGEFLRIKNKKDGYEAKAYLETYKNNKLIDKKQIRYGIYEAQDGIIYEGCEILPKGMTLPKTQKNNL